MQHLSNASIVPTSYSVVAEELPQCVDGLVLPAWQPVDNLSVLTRVGRGLVYFVFMVYLFLGVSIVSDRFMGAIEVITSQEREIMMKKKGSTEGQKIKVRVWNETVANLTLMALGSSAPEILLSVIEIAGKNFNAGELGPGTIVGSAAYNLFVIIAICVHVVPDKEVRRIKHLCVFFVTSAWAIFAYIWLYLILAVISPGVVECWESFLTFMFFPATVYTAYLADRKLKLQKFKKFRLNRNRVIVAAESGEIEAEKEIEEEILEECSVKDPHHFALIYRELKKRYPDATLDELEKYASGELAKRTHKSKAFYRLQASKTMSVVTQPGHLKRTSTQQEEFEVPGSRIYLSPDYYSVLENVGEFEVTVVREGSNLSQAVAVYYTTEDGTAVAGSDYEGATGVVVFQPNETKKAIKLKVIDDDIFEEDEHFYLHLTKIIVPVANGNIDGEMNNEAVDVILDEPRTATIVILDDDHCGVFGFTSDVVQIAENVGMFHLEVIRCSGARGRVKIGYSTKEGTAKSNRHFMETKGVLIFENNEPRKEIDIPIVEEDCYEKNVSFFVCLDQPQEIEDNKKSSQTRSDGSELSDEEKIALDGKPRLGTYSKIEVIIHESDEFKNTVNKLVEQEELNIGFSSWSEQFFNVFCLKPTEEGTEASAPTLFDYVLHCFVFFWKLLFALIPPADMYNGYLCFVISIVFIGILTAVIGDVASHFGCSVGLKDSVTAVTFVALGTSVPDTFASKVAAIQDSTADNSVGNVTGSNAVNVFLGIGIAWTIASFYHKYHGNSFYVNAGNLAFCVTLFCSEAVLVIITLFIRRSKMIGGELGGPKGFKYATSFFFFMLWIIYITMTTLEAYGFIEVDNLF